MSGINLLDFLPIVVRRLDDIRAAMDAEVNAGVAPGDPEFIDTTPGGHYFDLSQAVALEQERLWDMAATEVVAACFVSTAWGPYLDLHGVNLGVPRKAAAKASGTITVVASSAAYVGSGTVVGTPTVDPDVDPITFVTTETVVLPGPPQNVTATPSASGGTLPADTYFYVVTSINDVGETLASLEVSATTTGSTGKVTLDWDEEAGATGYRIFRSDARGDELHLVAVDGADTTTYVDTGGATGVAEPPAEATVAADVAVVATDAGSAGKVPTGSITQLVTPTDGVASLTNAGATTGGLDIESDEAYRGRLLLEIEAPQGAGNVGDYQRWSLAEVGVSHVTVEPLWIGPGTVRVIVTNEDNDACTSDVVDDLQTKLDPFEATATLNGASTFGAGPFTITVHEDTADFRSDGYVRIDSERAHYTGKTTHTLTGCTSTGSATHADGSTVIQSGKGTALAPIGAEVTVATVAAFSIAIVATVTLDDGYSLDGDQGTRAVETPIETAINRYVNALGPGEDVILHHVRAQFFRVRGVLDVPTLTLNAVAGNCAVSSLQVAQVSTVALS